MIRNIVFDMGNVLIRFDPEQFIINAGVTDPKDRMILLRELFQSAEWSMMDLGLLEEKTAEPLILQRLPDRLKEKASYLLFHWADDRIMIEGMEELVQKLRDAGYGIYLLSNASKAQPVYWKRLPVSRFFDGTMISALEKTVKPRKEIYSLFTDRFQLRPEECLFVDDATMNVAAAVECGWKGIVFHGDREELEDKMRREGIRI